VGSGDRTINCSIGKHTKIVPNGCGGALTENQTLRFSGPSESVRDTKGELMPCLEVHPGHDSAGCLSYTKVDGKLRVLHAPTMERQSPCRHNANRVSYGGRYHCGWQVFNASWLLQEFRAQQDRTPSWPFEGERGCPEQSSLVGWSVSHQPQQRGIGGFVTEIEHQRKFPDLGYRLGGYGVEVCVVRVLALDDAPYISNLAARHKTHRQGGLPSPPFR